VWRGANLSRWVLHTDELMVRYRHEGKAVYDPETDSRHWIGELPDLDEATPAQTLPGWNGL
jgi:hypothetical protein